MEIPAEPVLSIVAGLAFIISLVLILPFKVKLVEHNLEVFFLIMGAASVTVSGLWSWELVVDALRAPVMIGSLPISIFQVVLIVGLLVHFFHSQFRQAVLHLVERVNIKVFIFAIIFSFGIISSVISVILSSVLLAEIVNCLPMERRDRIKLVVLTCFSVGVGAVLTPLGEPMSTILVARLAGPPYYAGFFWPVDIFAKFVVPLVAAFALFGAYWIGRGAGACETTQPEHAEPVREVFVRAVKVFAFVSALVLLGEGAKPMVVWYLEKVPGAALFWVNITSAFLDNATLTAIEISPGMTLFQITNIVMGLLIAGGMLIPGNIPNIVAAGKLRISMREWAVLGVPIGLVVMIVVFLILELIVK
jgi:predicted cation transporter